MAALKVECIVAYIQGSSESCELGETQKLSLELVTKPKSYKSKKRGSQDSSLERIWKPLKNSSIVVVFTIIDKYSRASGLQPHYLSFYSSET